MKKQSVDTPYVNSWADRMVKGTLPIVYPEMIPVIFIEANKLMKLQGFKIP